MIACTISAAIALMALLTYTDVSALKSAVLFVLYLAFGLAAMRMEYRMRERIEELEKEIKKDKEKQND